MSNTDFNLVVTDIGFVICRPPNAAWHLDKMTNENYYIFALALSGDASYEVDKKEYAVSSGTALFFQKGQEHSAKTSADNPWAYYSVAFDLHFFSDESEALKLPLIFKVKNFVKYEDILKKLNMTWTAKQTGYILRCRSLITELLYLMVTESTNTAPKSVHSSAIDDITVFLAENYNKNYSPQQLAEMVGISTSHFRLIFKEHTGYTIIQYQNRLKINKACDILLSRACNITETAYALGFNDIFYFSRLFKKIMGISPTDFLKKP